MGPTYAGILGPLAMAVVMLRSLLHGGGVESTVSNATICLIAFAIVGWLVGTIAETTVDEAVRSKMQRQMDQVDIDPANTEAGNIL